MHLPSLASLTAGLHSTLLRFPVPTLFAALTSGLLFDSVDASFDDSLLLRFAFLTSLGFVASLLVDLIIEATGASRMRWIGGQFVMLILLLCYNNLAMPELLDDSRPPFWYSYFILLFALHLGIALVPSLTPGGPDKIWRFNLRCFLRYFFSSINAALLFGGLALALLSVDKLFELRIYEELYLQVWVLCAFLAHPMLFLGGLPRLRQVQEAGDFPKALRFSLCFIGLPLVGLYLFILYAYIGKIVLQWSWPNGWVAMPIFILGVISLLTYVLSLPLPKTETWARLYHRWLFRLLLPLSIVLFLALQVRLGDYGMTINRYLGLALALWLFGLSLAYILRPTLKIAWMPLSLLLVALVAIYGGPVGAFGWSERAQMRRIHDMADALQMIEAGRLVPVQEPKDGETVAEFQSALRYVLKNFGPEAMATELAGFHEQAGNRSPHSRSSHHLSNRVMNYLELSDSLKTKDTLFYAEHASMPTQGHSWMIDYSLYMHRSRRQHSRSYRINEDDLVFFNNKEHNCLSIQANDLPIIEIDLQPWAVEIEKAVKTHGNHHNAPLVWQVASQGWRFSFVCIRAQLDSKDSFQSASFRVFLSPPD